MAITVDGTARPDLDKMAVEMARLPGSHSVGNAQASPMVSTPITPAYSPFDRSSTLLTLQRQAPSPTQGSAKTDQGQPLPPIDMILG